MQIVFGTRTKSIVRCISAVPSDKRVASRGSNKGGICHMWDLQHGRGLRIEEENKE